MAWVFCVLVYLIGAFLYLLSIMSLSYVFFNTGVYHLERGRGGIGGLQLLVMNIVFCDEKLCGQKCLYPIGL